MSTNVDPDTLMAVLTGVSTAIFAAVVYAAFTARKCPEADAPAPASRMLGDRTWDSSHEDYDSFLRRAPAEQLIGDLSGLGEEIRRHSMSWDQDGPLVIRNRYVREAVLNASDAIVRVGKRLPAAVRRDAARADHDIQEARRAQLGLGGK